MGLPIILANKNFDEDSVLSASTEFDEFIDQPVVGSKNVGSLSLVSSGNYRGSATISVKVEIKVGGELGTSKFYFSDDGGTTFFGLNDNPVFEDFEVITENI